MLSPNRWHRGTSGIGQHVDRRRRHATWWWYRHTTEPGILRIPVNLASIGDLLERLDGPHS
jgi:hypothetical protein